MFVSFASWQSDDLIHKKAELMIAIAEWPMVSSLLSMKSLRTLSRFTFLFICLVCDVEAQDDLAPKRPNVVVFLVDDLGWNHISAPGATRGTGQSFFQTPNINRLADSGVSFPYCYAQPNCAPSRAALVTGQYPARIHNQVFNVNSLNRFKDASSKMEAKFIGANQSNHIASEAVTIAKALQKNGYVTAHIGKFHVGKPEQLGFDINIGGLEQGHQPACFANKTAKGEWEFKGLGRGDFDRYAAPYEEKYLARRGLPTFLEGTPKHICDATGDALVETIGNLSSSAKPFYLQFHPYAVHGPVTARLDLKNEALSRLPNAKKKLADYAGFISGVDENVGRLLAVLEDPNGDGDSSDSIAGNTIVIFSSDNGGTHFSNTPLRGEKGQFLEGGIRVPFIVSGSTQVARGKVSERMLHFVDVYPSILELVGADSMPDAEKHPLDGVSFASALNDPEHALEREFPIYYLFPGYLDERAHPSAGLLTTIDGKRLKLFYDYESDAWTLFDLDLDQAEQKNLIKEMPEIASTLSKKLHSWLTQAHPTWKARFPIDKASGKERMVPVI